MSAVTAIFVLTAVLYGAACVLYFVYLGKGSQTTVLWASRLLGAAVATHAGFLALDYLVEGRSPTADIAHALLLLSFLISVAYLISMRRARLTVLGAFITPVVLLLLLGAGLRASVPPVPDGIRSALLPLHIAVNVLGIVAFALAFAAAVAYMIQEQLLRRKRIIGVFQRLPALDVLDSIGLRLVTLGFPLFTLGMVTGTFWAAKLGVVSTGQTFALLAWLFFGSVLLARAAAGWRGRRAAIGTMLGFLCSMAALGGYLVRGMGG
jgi:ABC-type uncharacterized transport system permease subunit